MGLDQQFLYDNADVLWYGTNTYQDAVNALKVVTGKSDAAIEYMLNGQYGAADFNTACQALADKGVVIAKNSNGYNCFAYQSNVTATMPSGPMYQIDSNQTATMQMQAKPVYDTVVDTVEASPTYDKVLVNPMGNVLTPEHGFYGWKFFAAEGLQAIGAASAGIALGKTIDGALYNLNPDFWDANGMSTLNPETWASITNGDDSFAAGLFNMIFGIDPNTGKAQMFMDENAFAYMAAYMNQQGVFAPPSVIINSNTTGLPVNGSLTYPITAYGIGANLQTTEGSWRVRIATNVPVLYYVFWNESRDLRFWLVSDGPFNAGFSYGNWNYPTLSPVSNSFTHNNKIVYYAYYDFGDGRPGVPYNKTNGAMGLSQLGNTSWMLMYGGEGIQPVEGIGNQPNATLPDTTGWDNYGNVLPSLRQQYPDMWDNAVPNTVLQPDGTTKTITYVPVPMPTASNQYDTKPTTDDATQTQTQTQVEPSPETADLLKLILELITQPQPNPNSETETQTQYQPYIPTPNPDTTGTGTVTPAPIPAGRATALWSVYHPTQGQINDFGAWLWTDDVVQRFLQLMNNPMEGIISLHKIFIPPVDAGQMTIVVGRLDSEVPSQTVNQQYVYLDCGTVSMLEYFGSVFDYSPHTSISLYLPFIGIIPLNPDDVMRADINVTYGCDVFTGACLAIVTVTRDGNDVTMYQYAGMCSVQYPLTGAQSSGLISGLLGIAGGIAGVATAATGVGAVAGATAIAAGAANAGKLQNARSGGFSGNAGALGIKIPYIIIERPQTKVAAKFKELQGYPTNYSIKLGNCSGHVVISNVHVEGINATESELEMIDNLLHEGVLV